ncbi:MAG: alpha/beta hydrolase [Mycobacterium sp.]|nr:alpha/beta hydrolase [Mycobacterium sp.]
MSTAAGQLGRLAAGLSDRADRQQSSLDSLRSAWVGTASDAADAKARPTLEQMRNVHQSLISVQSALNDGAGRLTQSRNAILQSVSALKGQGWQVGADGTVSVQPGSPLDRYAKTSPVQAIQVQHMAATNSTALKTMLAGFDTTDRQVGENVRNAVSGLKAQPSKLGPGGPPALQAPPDLGSQIPEGKDPKDVKKWWDSLTDQQRQQLLRDHPDRIGGLDGVPTTGRDAANRAVMQQDLDRVNNAARDHHVSPDQVMAQPQNYGLTPNDITRYENANQVQDGLNKTHRNTGAPTYLQVYEPDKFDGRGRAAIAIGDPDKTANTTVVVPGTGNSVANGWLHSDDASNLYNEANKADRNNHTAVVAWMGYQAPDSPTDPQIGQTGLAHQGASLLAADVNALNATHDGPSHVTVMGHSYGSTTVADAAAGYGMHTNDVVLVGCPGTDMAHNATDFHLNGGHVYVGAASTDPVTQFGNIPQFHVPGTGVTVSLGNDPAADGFGSTRFKAEVPEFHSPFDDHSQYYRRGSESLFSMGDIASGHGDALEHDGMTAPHRGAGALGQILHYAGMPTDIPVIDDPETYRPGTLGHEHK